MDARNEIELDDGRVDTSNLDSHLPSQTSQDAEMISEFEYPSSPQINQKASLPIPLRNQMPPERLMDVHI